MSGAALANIVCDVLLLLRSSGILTETAFDDTKLDTLQEDAVFAAAVEAILKKHGVHTPDQVDRLIQLLPLLAGFIR